MKIASAINTKSVLLICYLCINFINIFFHIFFLIFLRKFTQIIIITRITIWTDRSGKWAKRLDPDQPTPTVWSGSYGYKENSTSLTLFLLCCVLTYSWPSGCCSTSAPPSNSVWNIKQWQNVVLYLTSLYHRKMTCCNKYHFLSISVYIALLLTGLPLREVWE